MKKNTLFLSAALTTFTLAIIAGVIKARANGLGALTNVVAPTAAVSATYAPTDTNTLSPTDSGAITPQEAAFIAGSAIGNSQIYSVDTVSQYGMDVYKVTFSSGAIVYVSPVGHILSITALVRYVTPSSSQGEGNYSGPSNGGGGGTTSGAASPTQASHGSDDGGSDDGSGTDH